MGQGTSLCIPHKKCKGNWEGCTLNNNLFPTLSWRTMTKALTFLFALLIFTSSFKKMHNWPALSSMVIPWISVLLGCLFRTELKSFDMTLNNSQNRYNFKWPGRSECAVFRDVWKKPWVWRVLFMITMGVHFHVHIKVLNMLYDRARFCDLKRNGILERIW